MKMNLQLFAGTQYLVKIYSNDGQTQLNSGGQIGAYPLGSNDTIYVTSTGVNNSSGEQTPCWTYSGNKIFVGLTATANSSTVDLPIGYSETLDDTITAFPTVEAGGYINLYIVEQETTFTYKHLLNNGNKIQVDSAIRDGNGLKIDTGYQKVLPTTSTAGKVLKSTSTAGTVEWGDDSNTNTWRPIKVNGTEKLTNSTSGNSLDLVAGSNVSLTESNGAVTISATDTTYVTNTTYNASTNKLATMADVPTITSTQVSITEVD